MSLPVLFLSTLKRLLFGVAFFFAAICQSGDAPTGQYPDSARSTKTTVTVNVIWVKNFEAVDAICSMMMQPKGQIVGCYNPLTHTIIAVEPINFNDHYALEILGHEFWHALGAMHP